MSFLLLFFVCSRSSFWFFFFFFNDTATTEIYTLSLHDALPIVVGGFEPVDLLESIAMLVAQLEDGRDRKSTSLNSSHRCNSYAVFCLKKKKDDQSHTENTHYLNQRLFRLWLDT